jgi:uncharacterized protein (UPF0276 family)
MRGDRVGLGWRRELAAQILTHADAIDVVEVMAEDFMGDAAAAKLRALETLAAQLPVVVHGLSLGLASASAVDERRLDQVARVIAAARPALWSEHLAFVRAGGIELHHLAAPPRCEATIAGAAANLARANAVVGARPLVENIATLIQPPGDLDEATWINGILAASGADLLLDLHNLYSNAANFGYDPGAFLARLPAARIRAVHIAGGAWVRGARGGRHRIDDHLHDVPEVVYQLLEDVAALVPHSLTVILERDGAYPPFAELLAELDRARAAIAAGRARRAAA